MKGVRLKNKYFILRHGETHHQIEKPDIVYFWPEDKPPASLTKNGQEQIKKVTHYLKNQKIDLIFSSDVLRTRQTAEIIAKELDLEVKEDLRLRDVNWGIYQGKLMKEAWAFYNHKMEEKFRKAPPQGESWLDVQKRMVDFLKETEGKYNQKTILIVSHGDPLWLLDSWVQGLNKEEMLKERKSGCPIKIGDLKELN
jgi:broad specificity phosphatase PhoE